MTIPPTKSSGKAKEPAGWAGLSTSPKGLFCSAGHHKGRRLVGFIPFQAVAWSVLAVTLNLVGSRRDLGFVPGAWSQCGDTGPSLFPAQQVEGRQEALLAPPELRGPYWGCGWNCDRESWIASGSHQR